ncbi:uncharacterized protein LOC136032124 isoform X2 [Artemia franciscana]|uniref:uncharacterized protein LOC136032124 isoform X2 n=1 Tax=Artemia franciscana TaxID=6661 RepID=UPI0032DAE407
MNENRVIPQVRWAQRTDCIYLTISLHDCTNPDIKIHPQEVNFKQLDSQDSKVYAVIIELYKEIVPEKCSISIQPNGVQLILKKKEEGPFWSSLLKSKEKQHWLKIDFNKWVDEEDDDCSEDKEFDVSNQPGDTQKPFGPTVENLDELLDIKAEQAAELRKASMLFVNKDYYGAKHVYCSFLETYFGSHLTFPVEINSEKDFLLSKILYLSSLSGIIPGNPIEVLQCMDLLHRCMAESPSYGPLPLTFAIAQGYIALNRYDLAKEAINDCVEHAKIIKPVNYPGITDTIPETIPSILISVLEQLRLKCSEGNDPVAVCCASVCQCDHRYPDRKMYLDDYNFYGYVEIQCDVGCRLQYHLQCWLSQSFFETEKKETIYRKYMDKEIIDSKCLALDCDGKIISFASMDCCLNVQNESHADTKEMKKAMDSKEERGKVEKTKKPTGKGTRDHRRKIQETRIGMDYVGALRSACNLSNGQPNETCSDLEKDLSYRDQTHEHQIEELGEGVRASEESVVKDTTRSTTLDWTQKLTQKGMQKLDTELNTKAEGFSLMENGTVLKNEHDGPVEQGKTVKGSQEVKAKESQEQSEKIKKKIEKRTKEGGSKTQTEETQTGLSEPKTLDNTLQLPQKGRIRSDLKHASYLFIDKKYRAAYNAYSSVLMPCANDSYKGLRKLLSSRNTNIIIYVCGLSGIISDDPNLTLKGMDLLSVLNESIQNKHCLPIKYGIAKGFLTLNRFNLAKEAIAESLDFAQEVQPSHYPETNKTIPESNPDELCAMLQQLLSESRVYRKPVAVCLASVCLSNHRYPDRKMYLNDYEFRGFVEVQCSFKCRLQYHLQCWKAERDKGISGKYIDKDIIGLLCFTPDCNGKFVRITSLDQNLNKKHECAADPEEKKKTVPEEKQEKSGKLSKRTRNKIGETGIKAPEENINIGLAEPETAEQGLQLPSKKKRKKRNKQLAPMPPLSSRLAYKPVFNCRPESHAEEKERPLPVGAPINWMPANRSSVATQESNGQVERGVNSPFEDFGAWLKRNFIEYLHDFGPLYFDHDSVLQVFKLFHCDADEFIFNCGGLYQYLMSRPEFVLIEDIICLQEHESFVIENIIKLSKRNPLKQNREFQSIFVLGEKKPGALSEIDDDFNGNYGDMLPSERVMISLRQGKPLGKNADVLDYKLRDVDDNFFEVFDSFHPTVNQYNANSDSSCHNTYSERVNLADIDDFDNSSDGTDGRGQTELLDYDGFPNESVLKGRTKLINFDELDAEVGPKGLAEIDDFDEFCEESILEEEYQTKPDCKSKTSSQSKKDKPKYALSKHYARTISLEPNKNEDREMKNEFEDLSQTTKVKDFSSQEAVKNESLVTMKEFCAGIYSEKDGVIYHENKAVKYIPVVEGENQVPPDQNSTDKVLIEKLNEILAKKDQVIDDLISLNETLKKKNCETLEKERRKLEEKFKNDERLYVHKLNEKENEVASLKSENEKLQLQVVELMNRLGSEILERNRRDAERTDLYSKGMEAPSTWHTILQFCQAKKSQNGHQYPQNPGRILNHK